MPRAYDAIVIGLGAMGAAASRALARRGLRVLGLDRFAPPHTLGSSHGGSRIIREAYFEDPRYVPFVQRAYLLWDELGREYGEPVFTPTGGLMIGRPGGVLVSGAKASAKAHGLRHEVLDAAALRRRYPAFQVDDDTVAVWEPRAGVLAPERAIAAFLAAARQRGAEIHGDEPALDWQADGDGVVVRTGKARYRADRVVLAAGPWLGRLVPELPLTVERVVQFWFETVGARQALDAIPIWIWEHERDRFIYGFPRSERGVKIARHHEGEPADPDHVRREVGPDEVASMRELLQRRLPFASGPLRDSSVCLYTNTPDGHFVIDRHPRHPQALILSVCSGHGFKFAPAIGEVVSDLLVEGWTRWDLEPFRLTRFSAEAAASPPS